MVDEYRNQVDCNLFTYEVKEDSSTHKKLELAGNFHLGEMVTKFIPGASYSGLWRVCS